MTLTCWAWFYILDLERKSDEQELILFSLIEISLDLDNKFVEREANFFLEFCTIWQLELVEERVFKELVSFSLKNFVFSFKQENYHFSLQSF